MCPTSIPRLSPDGKWLVFCANAGPDKLDLDRRHVVRVPVDKAAMEVLTPGAGLEWTPVATGDGATMAYISATAQKPPMPTVMNLSTKQVKVLGQEMIPAGFPEKGQVIPKKVTFTAPDGMVVHADLFEPVGGPAKKSAIVYIHGGPPRQMLLGWHYSDYYSNAYASNQYLANLGFVVLSVNYRPCRGWPRHCCRARRQLRRRAAVLEPGPGRGPQVSGTLSGRGWREEPSRGHGGSDALKGHG